MCEPTRREIAIAHYKGTDVGVLLRALDTEDELAKQLKGRTTPYRNAVDIVIDDLKVGIEVKTIQTAAGARHQVHMNKRARELKLEYAQRNNLRLYTIAVDYRTGTPLYYLREGIGGFRLGSMTPMKNPVAIRRHIVKATASVQAQQFWPESSVVAALA